MLFDFNIWLYALLIHKHTARFYLSNANTGNRFSY